MSTQTLDGRRAEGDPQRLGLLLPGGGYTPERPLLHFARAVLVSLGWTAQEVWWTEPVPAQLEALRGWVQDQLTAALETESAPKILLVGKSLGTFGALVAAQRQLPAIWLTPALRLPENVADLRLATAPALLIGGSSDPAWDAKAARDLERDNPLISCMEIDEVDHALETPFDPVNSVEVLKRVVAAMERFAADQAQTV